MTTIEPSLPEILQKVGVKIKESRIEAKLTQSELGARVGLSRQHISTIERGGNPSLEGLILILIATKHTSLLSPFFEKEPINPFLLEKIERHKSRRVRRPRK
jgi:transcriptional regulator with XRE-family HTH domain